jgi:hypothetical protein
MQMKSVANERLGSGFWSFLTIQRFNCGLCCDSDECGRLDYSVGSFNNTQAGVAFFGFF